MGVSKAHAGEEEPRERLACVDGNPVDEIAVEEGDLLRGALAATVDAADLLCASCHPEEQPLGMAAGFTEATKDQALVGQGIQVSLQGTDLALSTLKHIFQKNAIEFEQRDTSNEQRATSNE